MNYSKENHHKYSLKVHLVFVVKYRRKILKRKLCEDLKEILFNQQLLKFKI